MKIAIFSYLGNYDIGAGATIIKALSRYASANSIQLIIFSEKTPFRRNKITFKNIKNVTVFLGPGKYLSYLKCGNLFYKIQYPISFIFSLFWIFLEKPQLVIGIYPSSRMLMLATLSSKLLKIKLITWFHDIYADYQVGFSKQLAAVVEKFVIKSTDHNFAINKKLAHWYSEKYKKKFEVLAHPILESSKIFLLNFINGHDDQIHILFSGFIYKNCESNIKLLVEIVRDNQNLSLTLITPQESYVKGIIGNEIIDSIGKRITIFSSNNLSDIQDYYKKVDVLFLPLAFDNDAIKIEIMTAFPTKGIEYLASGKIILVHAPAESYLFEYMANIPGVILCKENDKTQLQEKILEACALGNSNLLKDKQRDLKVFQTSEFFKQIHEIYLQ